MFRPLNYKNTGIFIGYIERLICCIQKNIIDSISRCCNQRVGMAALSLLDIGLALIQLVIVTLIAVIYPIRVASNIKPLDAISRD